MNIHAHAHFQLNAAIYFIIQFAFINLDTLFICQINSNLTLKKSISINWIKPIQRTQRENQWKTTKQNKITLSTNTKKP